MPVAYDPTAAGRVRQMRIRRDKTGNFRLHRLPKYTPRTKTQNLPQRIVLK